MAVTSYAVWNNKGGVGKSTVAFHLATRYAELHPDARVLVIDMCPQANVSMMLLGGGTAGEAAVLQLCQQQPTAQTVVGYIANALAGGALAPRPAIATYLAQPHTVNSNIPPNLQLLSGDGNLELLAPLISYSAAQPPLLPNVNPWRWVHELLRMFVQDVDASGVGDLVVFVDTNPAFSIYTEIGVSCVDKLIVPVNADDASRVATAAMFTLIWGANPPHPIYGRYTFASQAAAAQLARPLVHLVIGNRLTQHVGAAGAFGAISNATVDELFAAYGAGPARFTARAVPPTTLDAFRDNYSGHLRDFNTAGVVAAHTGTPLSVLGGGQYDVYGKSIQVNPARVRECREAVDEVVGRL
jgi:cellulose biosynthesis protein BcsQ